MFYNAALVFVGTVTFVAYLLVAANCNAHLPPGHVAELEITAFTMLFEAAGYLCAMVVANLAYCLGPISELILRPNPLDAYRRGTFWLGFGVSVVAPLSIPLIVGLTCVRH